MIGNADLGSSTEKRAKGPFRQMGYAVLLMHDCALPENETY